MNSNKHAIKWISLMLIICIQLIGIVPSAQAISEHTSPIAAQSSDLNQAVLNAAEQDLILLQQKNMLAKRRLNNLLALQQNTATQETVNPALLEHAKLDVLLAKANLDSATISLTNLQQAIATTQSKIDLLTATLQHLSLNNSDALNDPQQIIAIQNQLNFEQKKQLIQQQELDELNHNVTYTQKIADLLNNKENNLLVLYKMQEKQAQQMALQQTALALQKEQTLWLDELSSLSTTVDNLAGTAINDQHNQALELAILKAQENSNLVHLKLLILNAKEQTMDLEQISKTDVPSLNAIIDQANDILANCNNIQKLIIQKVNVLNLQLQITKKNHEQNLSSIAIYTQRTVFFNLLLTQYQEQLSQLNQLTAEVTHDLTSTQAALNKALARRQGLPGFSLVAWQAFGQKMTEMPALVMASLSALKVQLISAYEKKTFSELLIIVGIECLWFGMWMLLKAGLSRYLMKITRKRDVSGNMLFIVLTLLKRNIISVLVIVALLLLQLLLALTAKLFSPFLDLIFVWFIFKLVIDVAKLILLETATTPSEADHILYTELKYGFMIGGVITMIMVLAHKLAVGYEVADFFNRLFMLFMLIISILVLRRWRVVPTIVKSTLIIHRPYLMRMVTLLSFLVPVTFFSTAIIGFLGYVDFAWTLARYEGLFLLVLSVYMLLCGLWNDIVEWLSELCITRFHHGWMITQIILKPLDNIIRLSLFFSIFISLYYLYDLTTQSFIIRLMDDILHFNLLQAKNAIITPLVILEFIAAGIIIYWISRWTRELSFRWLFAKSQDAGLRNSLSAFSQYAVVVLGILLSLQVIGIDLTGISYIFGGLAFGVAFGLRDLVKNYASGLLLLIERPVRTGDVVSIGNYEGEVTHIGMRSMTVKTWDHLEVLVPNSETFDKPFTNWTHLDSIVRTVIHLKISREDDPNHIRTLLLAVLKTNTFVVNEPPPQVYLMEMKDALMEFEVRYFINLQQGKGRSEIRSEVLFTICEIFKTNGIQLPYPPQDMYLHQC